MEKILDILSSVCAEAFTEAGYGEGLGKVSLSNRPDMCEFQCNSAMALAKREHKKPIDIANRVAGILSGNTVFSKVEACMPGFINMDVSTEFLAGYVHDMQDDADAGLIKESVPKDIIIDYGGANAAKPLHVGHLRSAVIGEALKRLGSAMGNRMTGDVHLGDWGLQMGLIIEELKDRGKTEFDLKDLEEIYPAASARSKAVGEDGKLTADAADFKARALAATGRLQGGDPECIAVWERIMELSKADLKKNYDSLNVHFELWKGESDVQKYIPDMLKRMEDDGVAHESQGALVVDIAEDDDTKEFPPCIVRKSDGAALYATTDLATLYERELLYHPDAYIYVADLRQSLHYLSFFRVAKKAGIVPEERELKFLGFGTMNGRDGKPFKTRAGGVMRLEELIADINEAVYAKIRATRGDDEISEAEARDVAKTVGLAALKYGDLSNQAAKDYIFDIDKFTSFEGNTGPYILYTIVRIGSILQKLSAAANAVGDKNSAPESAGAAGEAVADAAKASGTAFIRAMEASPDVKSLALVLSRYNETVQAAWEQLAPHRLCQFIYELSNAFNTFYHNVRIISEEDSELKDGYVAVSALTRRVLLDSIHMLGFDAPERM